MGAVVRPWVVLVVEDSQVFRSILELYLEDLVGTVLMAEDGAAGLEVLKTRRVDLVITDLNMPVMDGAQLVTAIRANLVRQVRELPVILLTAEKDLSALAAASGAGATELVGKPIRPDALRQAVTRLLTPTPKFTAPHHSVA